MRYLQVKLAKSICVAALHELPASQRSDLNIQYARVKCALAPQVMVSLIVLIATDVKAGSVAARRAWAFWQLLGAVETTEMD